MIKIVDVVKINQKKFKVQTDQKEIAFVVYKGDLLKYGLNIGAEISTGFVGKIYSEVLLPRAKRRGMYLLEAREYSVASLRDKLQKDGYPDEIIQEVVAYLSMYRYLDDERYIKAYIRTYAKKKSVQEIKRALYLKGITDEKIEYALSQLEEDEMPDEKSLIEKYLKKRKFDSKEATIQERSKMFHFLKNKGFAYDLIVQSIKCDD